MLQIELILQYLSYKQLLDLLILFDISIGVFYFYKKQVSWPESLHCRQNVSHDFDTMY